MKYVKRVNAHSCKISSVKMSKFLTKLFVRVRPCSLELSSAIPKNTFGSNAKHVTIFGSRLLICK